MERQLAAGPGRQWGCSHGAGTLQGAGTGEEEVGRMELPLGGQFQNAVWDEAVGKEDFTQPHPSKVM